MGNFMDMFYNSLSESFQKMSDWARSKTNISSGGGEDDGGK
jgi:hypothetical protein